MSKNSNMSNEVAFSFKISDLALLASAARTEAATAFCYGPEAEASRNRLKEIAQMFEAICPVHRSRRSNSYTWYDAFKAVEACRGYTVFIEETRVYSWRDPDHMQLVMVVDGKRYNLTDAEKFDEGKVPNAMLKAAQETEELAKRAAPIDAERLVEVTISVDVPYKYEGGYYKEEQVKRGAAVKVLEKTLKSADREIDVYISTINSDWAKDAPNRQKLVLLVRPSEVHDIEEVFMPGNGPSAPGL